MSAQDATSGRGGAPEAIAERPGTAATVDGAGAGGSGRSRSPVGAVLSKTKPFRPVLALVFALALYFSLTQSAFLTQQNVENLLNGAAVLWIVSMGMTFVLLAGGLDLSVGAILSLAAILIAKLLGLGLPGGLVVPIAIAFGALLGGLFNGVLIGKLGLSFFVVTLATMIAGTGAVDLWSQTNTFFVTDPVIVKLGVGHFLGLSLPIWVMIATFLVALYVQLRTYFGRDVYAVGGSIVAARLSGVRTPRTLIAVYGLVGAFTGLAAVVGTGRIGAATPQVDNSLPLQATAAVLLGGTSLMGGSGGVGGTAVGVLFIGVLENGLSIAGVQSFWQQVVTGVILVVAVLGDRAGVRQGGWRAAARRLRGGEVAAATGVDDAAA